MMNNMRRVWFVLPAMALALLLPAFTAAQTTLTATPEKLTFIGTVGDVQTRTLLLSAGEVVTGLQVVSLDLSGGSESVVLSREHVQVGAIPAEMAAGGFITVPITLDLHNVPRGQFEGSVLIGYAGGSLKVPVSVSVKDSPVLPLIVLLLGVGLATLISTYRAQGQPQDELLIRIGRVRTQTASDNQFVQSFQEDVERSLIDAEVALQTAKLDAARQAVEQAEGTLTRWRKYRANWLQQFTYASQLLQNEQVSADASPYLQAVKRDVSAVVETAPGLADPAKLREKLDIARGQISRYLELRTRIDEINTRLGDIKRHLSAEQYEPWQQRGLQLQKRLNDLAPSDEQSFSALQEEVESTSRELKQVIASLPKEALAFEVEKGLRGVGALMPSLLAAPSILPPGAERRTMFAQWRLGAFVLGSYVIIIALLAGAGFSELYVTKATFGAEPWRDYFALLAWGFGAEATRAAVLGLVSGWGLPGIRGGSQGVGEGVAPG